MGQDHLSKEEAGELLDKRVHVLASSQELQHSTRNFMKLAGDYLVAASHSPLRAAIRQGLRKGSSLQGIFDGLHPQTCSVIFTLIQHDHHRRSGVRGPHRVRGSSEKCVERGVVDLDAGMGGLASAKGGVTPEIQHDGGGRRDTVFKNGVDLQLWTMERTGEMTVAARLENLCIPLAADGREICLRFLSKRDCISS